MAGNRWYRPSNSRVFNRVDLHFWVHTKLSGQIIAKCSKRHLPSSGLLVDLFGSIWHRALRKTQFAVNTITIVSTTVNLWFLHVCVIIAVYVLLFVHVIDGHECGTKEQAVSMLVMDSIWSLWLWLSRWWFEIFDFHPYLGKVSNLTNICQRGWNHQLDIISLFFCALHTCFFSIRSTRHVFSGCEPRPGLGINARREQKRCFRMPSWKFNQNTWRMIPKKKKNRRILDGFVFYSSLR